MTTLSLIENFVLNDTDVLTYEHYKSFSRWPFHQLFRICRHQREKGRISAGHNLMWRRCQRKATAALSRYNIPPLLLIWHSFPSDYLFAIIEGFWCLTVFNEWFVYRLLMFSPSGIPFYKRANSMAPPTSLKPQGTEALKERDNCNGLLAAALKPEAQNTCSCI